MPKADSQLRVIDYGTAANGRSFWRIAAACLSFLKHYWLVVLIVVGGWVFVSRWQAAEFTRRSVAVEWDSMDDAYDRNGSCYVTMEMWKPENDYNISRYDVQLLRGRIGNFGWTVPDSQHAKGPNWRGGKSCSPGGFHDAIPNAFLPAAGGPVTVTYTLEVTARPDPWRSFFYFGSVTETVERSVTIIIPPHREPIETAFPGN